MDFLAKTQLPGLFSVLAEAGYRVLAPSVSQGAIRFCELDSLDGLKGIQAEQAPGHYRLHRTDSPYYFSWAVGPEAIKPITFCASEPLWRSDANEGLSFEQIVPVTRPTALIGARACDLAAFALQKQHFQKPPLEDSWFVRRTGSLLIIAVDCHVSAATCFCHSTGDGPAVTQDYDLRLHELPDGFLIQSGSEAGQKILTLLSTDTATDSQQEMKESQIQASIAQQTRALPSENLQGALTARYNADAWQSIAERCLSCGNCTAVCPTCFCHSQQDLLTDNPGVREHVRQWDSCFTEQHSYIHGIVIRKETRARYRQWLTHKLDSWHEQYGRSGCVGCGRCITWCPVGIDITESVKQVLEDTP